MRASTRQSGSSVPSAWSWERERRSRTVQKRCVALIIFGIRQTLHLRSHVDVRLQMNSAAPLRGFDLLRATAGLSEDDVRTMRRQFHRTRDVDVERASLAHSP